MIESLPVWFWAPAAATLWGYLSVDALARRARLRRAVRRFTKEEA